MKRRKGFRFVSLQGLSRTPKACGYSTFSLLLFNVAIAINAMDERASSR
jgi:hypothetical protein